MKIEKLVPDTSVIIEGIVSKKLESKEIVPKEVIIHEAILAELEHQANMNKTIGYFGLEEIKKLKDLSKKLGFSLEFSGGRPRAAEIRYAKLGEIDFMIRQLAYELEATLITADKVQAKVAEAKGIRLMLIELKIKPKKIKLESFFDSQTMSVHLKEGVNAFAKKGMPGNWVFDKISPKKLEYEEVKEVAKEIIEQANSRRDSFIEVDRPGSTIVQLGLFRIVITRPPFSDGWEITAVRPVKKLSLTDYSISEKLKKRLEEQAEGVLIAGSPGMGKSTFSQALAESYVLKNKIIKTVEAPRDLVLPDEITQYAVSHGTPEEIRDILLLSRPDYTLFDEMRNTQDFLLFSDLRLAGVGMIGVIHATNPIDAIQRFIGRIELGVIPHVIDTVLFIKNGTVAKTFSVQMKVKVPSGMTESDLARPIVVVSDFETQQPEFEIYSYGEQTVVIPIQETQKTPLQELAKKQIEREFLRYTEKAEVEFVSENRVAVYVPEKYVASIIGKQGSNIDKLEEKLGIGIDVRVMEEQKIQKKEIPFDMHHRGNSIILTIDNKYVNKNVDLMVQGEYLFTVNVGKKGEIRIKKGNKLGKRLEQALKYNEKVSVVV
ncbi:PINc/VapC family ATPase [Candidatus Woesearchaeota archaeon]|nr:PINc/VapC family ATPase [Candidatus Woesearchaeota archaeon]